MLCHSHLQRLLQNTFRSYFVSNGVLHCLHTRFLNGLSGRFTITFIFPPLVACNFEVFESFLKRLIDFLLPVEFPGQIFVESDQLLNN